MFAVKVGLTKRADARVPGRGLLALRVPEAMHHGAHVGRNGLGRDEFLLDAPCAVQQPRTLGQTSPAMHLQPFGDAYTLRTR